MPYKPFKIFVINCSNDETTVEIQHTALSTLLQSTLADKAEILNVSLESAADWMPPGHMHVQRFGSLQVMCNHEGDLTENSIQTMTQICHDIPEVLRTNLRLSLHQFFNNEKNDDELHKTFLSLQYAAGQTHYAKIKSKLNEAWAQHYQNAAEFKERSDVLAAKMADEFSSFLDKALETAKLPDDDHEAALSAVEEDFNNQMSMLKKQGKDDEIATLAKKKSLEIKITLHGFFAQRTAEGYRLPEVVEVRSEVKGSSLGM